MNHWTWGEKCYTGHCNGLNVQNGICDKQNGCQWCRPVDNCFECEQYSKLIRIVEPPTSVNTAINTADKAMFDLSGGMSLYNAHFRPTVVPPFGQNHLPIRLDQRNNITQYFQQKHY